MDEIVNVLRTPVFWICSVLVGLFGNIAANYLQRVLDKLFGSWNSARTRRAVALNKKFNDDLRLLDHHTHLIQFAIAAENRHRIKGAIEAAFVFGLLSMTVFQSAFHKGPLTTPEIVQLVFFLTVITMTGLRAWRNLRETAYYSTLLAVIYEHHREELLKEIGPASKDGIGPVTLLI